MKKVLSPTALSYLTLGLSGIGLALRAWLYGTGLDNKGLLISGHPAQLLVWLLAAAAVAILVLQCRRTQKGGRYSDNFPPSLPAFIGSCLAAVGIFFTVLTKLLDRPDLLNVITGMVGVLCFPALIVAGYNRWKGTRPSFLLHVLVCIFFALRLFCQYRVWSSNPQLQNYCFQLLACVCLMLTAYQRAAFDVNMGNRPFFLFLSLASVFFCCLSLPSGEEKLFYLTVGIWAFTNLCAPTIPEQEETHEHHDPA